MVETQSSTAHVQEASIPNLVVETHFKHVWEAERKKILQEVSWRRVEKEKSVDDVAFEKLNDEEEKAFLNLASKTVQSYPVTEQNWSSEQVLIGDYALRVMGSDGLPDGYLTFGLTNTGDAIIMQVQGKKGRWFTPQKRDSLVQKTLSFLKDIHVKRAFLISGDIINLMRKTPDPHLLKVYSNIAQENGFNNKMWGLPYVDLNEPQ